MKEDLTNELDVIKGTLKESQLQMEELTTENATKAQQIRELEKECAELSSKVKAGEEGVEELREQLTQLR